MGDGARRYRLAVLLVLAVLLTPVTVSGLTHETPSVSSEPRTEQNVTFISTQGQFRGQGGGDVVAINTDSHELLWRHSEYNQYYDVDPLNGSAVLIVGGTPNAGSYAQVINWRTGETLLRFEVPWDTHDVDRISNSSYAVADKFNHRIYVYNTSTESITWEYEFEEHWPPYPEAGGEEHRQGGEYTHLNDVDVVDNGSAFVVSPRNFDRVMRIDRETKRVEWVLGEQGNHSVIHRQHNPSVISQSPRTVLVADSENDRVVEYQRQNDSWRRTWSYSRGLSWPRDADRLPNGNTLIVDTEGQRVIEVTPEGRVVWQHEIRLMPYDVERLRYGDEPGGPASAAGEPDPGAESNDFAVAASDVISPLRWVLPVWMNNDDVLLTLGALAVGSVWAGAELVLLTRRRLWA